MIPLRLAVRDFLSYGSPDPIDFTGFDVACLSGDNGAGKSALLDGMTYALFGAARGCESGQNQERLIREGADETVVEFIFELGGATYQIVRKRTRTTKGNEVRFQVMTPDGWTNLAKNSVRETDRHIQHILRMDYKTFVNSAFFLQGRADEFLSAMTPDDRKEVFAKLLDLGMYERLESAARERARAAERTRAELAAQAERLAEAAPDPDSIQAELDAATTAAEKARASSLDAERVHNEARDRVAEIERQEAVLTSEARALQELEQSFADARGATAARASELEEIDALSARSDEVQQALEEIEQLSAAEAGAREGQAAAAALREQVAALTERLRTDRIAVELRCEERTTTISALTHEHTVLGSAEKDLAGARAALADSDDVDAEIERVARELEERRAGEGSAREALAAANTKLAEVTEKLELLKAAHATCPVCEGPLDKPHRLQIVGALRAEAKEIGPRRKRIDAERESCRKEVRRLTEESARLTKVQRERSKLEGALAGLEARVQRRAVIGADIDRLGKENVDDVSLLQSTDFGADIRAQIDDLTARIERLYDPDRHTLMQSRLAELRPFEQLQGRLGEASARRPRVEEDLERCRAREAELGDQIPARREHVRELTAAVQDPSAARAHAADCEQRTIAAARASADADLSVATLGERLEGALRTHAQVDAARRGEVEAAAIHRRYECLVKAFGRGGIPDRIIGNALPELQAEANDILGRLSDFEMGLQFRLDRETKSGKVRETFDVLVSHDGGVRDFKMFSGGEAFRIAFAVRLGLSKLLVRRSGAKLETLVVDEGFGTQDPSGRERLIEAIDIARGEFAKVLVITHLDELKDVFGAQIRVTKDPVEGSRLDICS